MSNKPKKGPTPNRQGLYAAAAKYAVEAIEVLANEMRNGDNSSARTGAAKTLLSKTIPDLKAIELTGDEHAPVLIRLDVIKDGKDIHTTS